MTPFHLIDAHSARDAVMLLRSHAPRARPIAAGGDLLGLLKEHVSGPTLPTPNVLVNLATAKDLAQITHDERGWRIGAMVTLARLAREPSLPPVFAEAIGHSASPQLRARTTLGGNLLQRPRCLYFRHPDVACFKKGGTRCAADDGPERAFPGALFRGVCQAGHPSDLAPVLIALGAQAEVASAEGARTLPLIDLYADAASNPHGETQLQADELLVALRVPTAAGAQAFHKVAPREANEFSWAGAAVALACEGERIVAAHVVLSGVAPGPHRCEGATTALAGRLLDEIVPAQVAAQLIQLGESSAAVCARAAAARLAIERALSRALQRARPEPHNARSEDGA